MKKPVCIIILLCTLTLTSFSQKDYFYPPEATFDQNIPSPWEFLGYEIGEWHTRHDRIVAYMLALSEASDRAQFNIIGYTYEHRPQVILTVSSPENLNNLEGIRQAHLELSDPTKAPDISSMPVIVQLGYNVHGNEPSSSEASMLMAYYLVAGNNEEIRNYRDQAIFHIEPVLNPDGRDRHSLWANMHKGFPPVADPDDREHNEGWPRGRTNHYWFDLNRDWLPLVHVESRNRVEFFHKWLPNVVTDYHEMGTNSTYFFEPTKPFGSENPIVPRTNYDQLNNLFAGYFQDALDQIGSLYWSKEVFDNSYPGYGNTYPDIHGGLGLVFEQASSRGHVQETNTGEITFAFTIRNHLRTSIATAKASVENRETLLNHQQEFFRSALDLGQRNRIKAYIFGDQYDETRNKYFLELLLRHQIDVYANNNSLNIGGNSFQAGRSYVVPTDQRQFRMVQTLFDQVTEFYDSVFYDASAWDLILGYGLPFSQITGNYQRGDKITWDDLEKEISAPGYAKYAYLFDLRDYHAHMALYHLLKNDVNAKTGFRGFSIETNEGLKSFSYGTIMVPVADQNISAEKLHSIISEASTLAGIPFYTVETGLSLEGVDLGSRNFRTVEKPEVMMIIGDGTSSYETGEVWHLFDTKVGMPLTKVDISDFRRTDLDQYNVLILVSGGYNSLGESAKEDILEWVGNGGTLITQRGATRWIINNEWVDQKLKESGDKEESGERPSVSFEDASNYRGARAIGGSFYRANIDITNPLAFGYHKNEITVYRNSTVFLQPSENPVATVIRYQPQPLLSGYIHPENLEIIKNSAAAVIEIKGRGRVIMFSDNPNFRGFMFGTNKLFMNAVFFGPFIDIPSLE